MKNVKFLNEAQAKNAKVAYKKTDVAIVLAYGNTKLQDSEKYTFLQWNMMSGRLSDGGTCTYLTEACFASCYARKAERMYPSAKERRTMHTDFSKTDLFVPAMIEQVEYELGRKRNKGKTILFRIHESGDFYSQEYMNKWVEIANHFKGRDIVFMAYTKSLPYIKGAFKKYGDDNVNIQFKSSIWDDTKAKFKAMTNELGLSVFTAMPVGQLEENGYIACPTSAKNHGTEKESTCGKCTLCYTTNKNVAIEIH